jgi:hypothetical protein
MPLSGHWHVNPLQARGFMTAGWPDRMVSATVKGGSHRVVRATDPAPPPTCRLGPLAVPLDIVSRGEEDDHADSRTEITEPSISRKDSNVPGEQGDRRSGHLLKLVYLVSCAPSERFGRGSGCPLNLASSCRVRCASRVFSAPRTMPRRAWAEGGYHDERSRARAMTVRSLSCACLVLGTGTLVKLQR